MGSNRIFERLGSAVNLPSEPVPGQPLIEIFGNSRVLVENHCGVMLYNAQLVCIKTKRGCIQVHGSDLVLSKMSKEQLCVRGNICSVELKRGG